MRTRKEPLGDKNIVGNTIRQLRIEKKLTQATVVARLQVYGLDINISSYSKLENQVRGISDTELLAIARVLNTTVDRLFPKDVQNPANQD